MRTGQWRANAIVVGAPESDIGRLRHGHREIDWTTGRSGGYDVELPVPMKDGLVDGTVRPGADRTVRMMRLRHVPRAQLMRTGETGGVPACLRDEQRAREEVLGAAQRPDGQ